MEGNNLIRKFNYGIAFIPSGNISIVFGWKEKSGFSIQRHDGVFGTKRLISLHLWTFSYEIFIW